MTQKPKTYHEDFARFFEEPTREYLRQIFHRNIGELRNCDFKENWPEKSSLAKHILAMANSGGGAIIVGVSENEDNSLEPVGLESLKDKSEIIKDIKKYLPEFLLEQVDIVDFSYNSSEYEKIQGKKFQVLFVSYDPSHLPFLAKSDGRNIKSNRVYVRKEGLSDEATHEELQQLINKRIETGYSSTREISLEEHLNQLKVLYKQIPRLKQRNIAVILTASLANILSEPNPKYPKETFEDFILKLIDLKKIRIMKELDVEIV